ncbi:amidase [Corynebacterium sp. sy017]|uniref:amidase family protein n=1 Tax=unclassified Corynebacterium TaxID=2624378 RepID=UPI0011863605|nr:MULTISPECIES: amidase family protein [unclassified Corynebacterium]MBP3088931.1 amidase [Corynebacterium sp. sy017]TSD91259.1 amidase [Corynebacterium sp. SY003]
MMIAWHTFDAHQWREAVEKHGAYAGIEAALARLEQHNPTLNAFTVVLKEEALARAQELDAMPANQRGVLHGVPVAIKDENDVAGTVTTFGTNANSIPKKTDSLTVQRLRDAGAIIIGKTTMPAFGAFPFTESEAFGITRNPRNHACTPGGSSGGSAAAVAAGIVPLALGGDGGGSIRIPADRCGLVGLKPARGVVPTTPYDHLWYHLGVAGPIVRSVRDAELMFDVITGRVDSETTSEQAQATVQQPKKLRIGVNLTPCSPLAKLPKDHQRAVENIADQLRSLGHQVDSIDRRPADPTLPFVVQFFAGLIAEIKDLDHPEKVEKLHKYTTKLGFWARGPVLRWALKHSERFGERMERNFAQYDVLLTPTTASRPDKIGVLERGGLIRAMIKSIPSIAYVMPWNVSGHPALALPVAVGQDGLPVSVQFIAGKTHPGEGEKLLCQLGKQLEDAGLLVHEFGV